MLGSNVTKFLTIFVYEFCGLENGDVMRECGMLFKIFRQ